jgi:hypothetical protein
VKVRLPGVGVVRGRECPSRRCFQVGYDLSESRVYRLSEHDGKERVEIGYDWHATGET